MIHLSLRRYSFAIGSFLLSLGWSGLVLAEDATAIARSALQVSPPGNWTLSSVLSTEAESSNREKSSDIAVSGERILVIRLEHLQDGGRQVIYRPEENRKEGVRVMIPRQGSIQITDLTTGTEIKDFKALFLGSIFSMEDITLRFLTWKTQKLLGEETLKDRVCWRIESYPEKNENTAYARVESWIDREYRGLLKAVAYNSKGEILKEFNVRSLQQMDTTWMLKRLDLRAPMLKAKSRLEILDAKNQ